MSRGGAETREGGAGDGDAGQRHLALSRAATATAPGARARLRAALRFREEKTKQNASATADFSAAQRFLKNRDKPPIKDIQEQLAHRLNSVEELIQGGCKAFAEDNRDVYDKAAEFHLRLRRAPDAQVNRNHPNHNARRISHGNNAFIHHGIRPRHLEFPNPHSVIH